MFCTILMHTILTEKNPYTVSQKKLYPSTQYYLNKSSQKIITLVIWFFSYKIKYQPGYRLFQDGLEVIGRSGNHPPPPGGKVYIFDDVHCPRHVVLVSMLFLLIPNSFWKWVPTYLVWCQNGIMFVGFIPSLLFL